MTVQGEERAPGWRVRKALDGDDWSGVTGRREGAVYWVREHTDGRVTRVHVSPSDALRESTAMDMALPDEDETPATEAPAARPDEAEGARRKILSDLEAEQRGRWPRLNELTEKAVGDVWLADEESEEFERLGGEYEGTYDAAVEALGGDTDVVQEVRDRVESAAAQAQAEEPPDGGAMDTPGETMPDGVVERMFAGAKVVSRDSLFPTTEAAPALLAQQIHPSLITTHPSTLMRAGGLDPEHVDSLEAKFRGGGSVPAVDVFYDGFTHWLGDGNHRHAAALRADVVLDVNVQKGTLRDAILHAVRANAEHGLKRTNDDKRLAVVTLLADEEWGRLSDTQVKELADVSQPFVGKVQAWLVKLLPILGGDGVEDPSDVDDEEFAMRADVPEGLVSAVRGLTDAQLASLSNNVIARAESRTSKDGKQFSVEQRPAADEPPPLLAGVEPAPDTAGDAQEVTGEAEEPAAEVSAAPARGGEQAGEEIVVNGRRRFAGELPAHVASTSSAPLEPFDGTRERVAPGTGEEMTPAPLGAPAPPEPSASQADAAVVTRPAPPVPVEALTFVINVKAGKTQARALTLSGRIGDGTPVWLSDLTLADLSPMPPALLALVNRLSGAAPPEPMKTEPAPSKKHAAKKTAAKKSAVKLPAKGRSGKSKKGAAKAKSVAKKAAGKKK